MSPIAITTLNIYLIRPQINRCIDSISNKVIKEIKLNSKHFLISIYEDRIDGILVRILRRNRQMHTCVDSVDGKGPHTKPGKFRKSCVTTAVQTQRPEVTTKDGLKAGHCGQSLL